MTTASLESVAVNLCSALESEATLAKPVAQDLWIDILHQNDIWNMGQTMQEANNAIAAALQEDPPGNLNSEEQESTPRTSTVNPVTPLPHDVSSSAASSRPTSPSTSIHSHSHQSMSSSGKKRKILQDDGKRQERNAREKARSNKISNQFDDLKAILIRAGVAVPRSTKGSILDSAMAYIQTLQVQAHQSEL
jgi:N-acetylmuramoyl-L-alanine amidase CwlA